MSFVLPKIDSILPVDSRLSMTKITIDVKIAPNPFAEGNARIAFHGIEVSHSNKKVVFKESKRTGKGSNAMKRYIEDMETQTISAALALEFSQKVSLPTPIKFGVAKIAVFPKTQQNPLRFMARETLLVGDYEKFNNNAGVVVAGSEDLQAFSHWTYVRTKGKMIVVDLQGVKESRGLLLTDPAIHSLDLLRFGKTNLGPRGMRLFFDTHKCNSLCQMVGVFGKKFNEF